MFDQVRFPHVILSCLIVLTNVLFVSSSEEELQFEKFYTRLQLLN